jgi:hypothetical protein
MFDQIEVEMCFSTFPRFELEALVERILNIEVRSCILALCVILWKMGQTSNFHIPYIRFCDP